MVAGSVVVGAVLLAALCPAGGIKVMHGPESTKPASPPACGARRLLVDLEDAPLYDDGSNLWSCDPFEPHRAPHVGARAARASASDRPAQREESCTAAAPTHPPSPTAHPAPTAHAGSPMGSIVFALVDEARPELGRA